MQYLDNHTAYSRRILANGSSRARVLPPGVQRQVIRGLIRTHAGLVYASSSVGSPLVVVGSVNADIVLPIKELPKPGETIGAADLALYAGGKGANQAAAAAMLGYPTYFIGQVGDDANAKFLASSLSGCGVNLQHLREVEGPSGTAVIMLQEGGENSIIIVGGANQSSWDLSERSVELIQSAGAVLLQREIPEQVNVRVAKLAREAGVRVILDAGGVDMPLSDELLQLVSVLSPNETELSRLSGMSTRSDPEVRSAAAALQARGVDSVLVKLGAEGSLLVQGGEAADVRQGALPAERVVDTTGAGDCFTASFAVALLEGQPPAAALQFAAAAACLCVQRPGAMPSMPPRHEVDALLARQPVAAHPA